MNQRIYVIENRNEARTKNLDFSGNINSTKFAPAERFTDLKVLEGPILLWVFFFRWILRSHFWREMQNSVELLSENSTCFNARVYEWPLTLQRRDTKRQSFKSAPRIGIHLPLFRKRHWKNQTQSGWVESSKQLDTMTVEERWELLRRRNRGFWKMKYKKPQNPFWMIWKISLSCLTSSVFLDDLSHYYFP